MRQIEGFLLSPFVGLAMAAILVVVGWKLNATFADWLLVLAWVLIVVSVFRTQPIARQVFIQRSLWTMFIAAPVGLGLCWLAGWQPSNLPPATIVAAPKPEPLTPEPPKRTEPPKSVEPPRSAAKTEVQRSQPLDRLGAGPDPYKDMSDEQVGQWAIEEADKITEIANSPKYDPRQNGGIVSLATATFTQDFNSCCTQFLQELHAEVVRRLGPLAQDPEEDSAWRFLYPALENPALAAMPHVINILTVERYAPYLRSMGGKLKQRQNPTPQVASLTDGQKFFLAQELRENPDVAVYEARNGMPNSVRLILVGNDPKSRVFFAQIMDAFRQAQWTVQEAMVGSVTVVGGGLNFPDGPYLTGNDIAAPIITGVFGIFSQAGINLPLVPYGWSGSPTMGNAAVAIIVH